MTVKSTTIECTAQSGQETDKRLVGSSKFTGRYWFDRVFLPVFTNGCGEKVAAGEYRVKIQVSGRRENVRLRTSLRREAAERAAKLYSAIRENGWDRALATLDPMRRTELSGATLGQILEAIKTAAIRPRTIENYVANLRWWAARYYELRPQKRTYSRAGSQEWRAKLDATAISVFTAETAQKLIAKHIAAAGSDAVKARSARISVATFLRGARAGLRIAARKNILLPSPSPFSGVRVEGTRMPAYRASFRISDLLASAREELREKNRDAWLTIILALGAGLRRGELANLRWRDIEAEGRITITPGGTWMPKTLESEASVFIDQSLVSEMDAFRRKPDDYVLAPACSAKRERCQYLFDEVISWLRAHGVMGNKPLHTLRKEFGSIIAQAADLFTASKQLRHASLSVTAMHYVENRKQIAPNIHLLASAISK